LPASMRDMRWPEPGSGRRRTLALGIVSARVETKCTQAVGTRQ
jgi:hypothetical protein